MRLDIVNRTSHPDAPVHQMYDAVGVQLFHFAQRWPGSSHVVVDLMRQGFYLELIDDMPKADAGALGYHDVDTHGRPYSKIAVNPSLTHGSDWLTGPYSVVATVGHEALETVGDPIINIWRDMNAQQETAQEMCDAVEATGYHHNGMDLTNFLLPSWFNPWGKAPYDYLGQLDAPFTMTPGGYIIVREAGEVSQQTASMPAWRNEAHPRAQQLGLAA